ncbi:MAG: DNA methyltransferase [Chloroflexi bacterium]|nr:DNA methyltransferase [Chloroflexota bacterium]
MQREAWYGCYREQWTVLLTDDAFGHPAKMARGLVYRLVRTGLERGWWRRDTLMVDPFGGVGTTGLACSAHGLESLLVELEPRFVRIADGYDCPGVRSGAAPEDLCPECLDPERADKRDPDALPATSTSTLRRGRRVVFPALASSRVTRGGWWRSCGRRLGHA